MSQMEKTKLIIADYRKEDLELMKKVLSPENYEIQTVSTGVEALNYIVSFKPEIIILDVNLQDSTGYDICRAVRKEYLHVPSQIIIVSDSDGHNNLQKTVEAGGDDFISKPFDPQEFSARVKAAKIRLEQQMTILREKEFYRRAVKQEEELTSKILDQNIHLKDAYQKLISANKELSETNKHLEKIAKYDFLSGLLNRMSLFTMIEVEIDRCLRTGLPLSGVMMDIDNFKEINDNFGHHYGDAVIQEIGTRLLKTMRKYDYAGRYGGEEFFIILPNTEKYQAISIAERFRGYLQENPILAEDITIPITASFGISTYKPGDNMQSWVSRADKAMYEAKQSGKNKVYSE